MSAPRSNKKRGTPPAQSDRWIWGVWVAVLLVAVAILPFSARLEGVARAIAAFCGFAV